MQQHGQFFDHFMLVIPFNQMKMVPITWKRDKHHQIVPVALTENMKSNIQHGTRWMQQVTWLGSEKHKNDSYFKQIISKEGGQMPLGSWKQECGSRER